MRKQGDGLPGELRAAGLIVAPSAVLVRPEYMAMCSRTGGDSSDGKRNREVRQCVAQSRRRLKYEAKGAGSTMHVCGVAMCVRGCRARHWGCRTRSWA